MPRLCLLTLALLTASGQQPLTLEIRTFLGTEDVTGRTRIIVHRAGERARPVAQVPVGDARATMRVPPGIYDAQAVEEREGKVANIRWAERLVVMPYPDENGHHLEVINFLPGYGALQIRAAGRAALDEVAMFPLKQRDTPAAAAPRRGDYQLFVVRAGQYDLRVGGAARGTWHNAIDVPLDRTRLWIVP
jgi:hypothetical protein